MDIKSNAYWKDKLSTEQYRVMREKGTERAFTGAFYQNHETGMYSCGCCGEILFSSDTKFDSGTGWPSFYDVATANTWIMYWLPATTKWNGATA